MVIRQLKQIRHTAYTAGFGIARTVNHGLNASVEAVPFELSKTCYGLGVSFEADEFDSAVGALSEEEIEWLRLWNQNNAKKYVLAVEKGK